VITLFTGMPGAGKTAAMIDLLRELSKDRPLFVHFDPAERLRPEQKLLSETLLLPHTPVNAASWHEQVPDGGILVIDEAQGCWRPRGPASKVPECIAALETHRHAGVDIFLTTQAPRLIDANVRGLVGRHVHIRDTGWLGRWWYEWPETNESLTWKSCPVKKRYKLPRKVFELYRSASVHTIPVRMTPKTLFVLGLLLLFLTLLIWRIVSSINKHTEEPAKPVSAPAVQSQTQAQRQPQQHDQAQQQSVDERVDFFPRLSDRPWTAPAYDQLRHVVRMPVISSAICINDDCRCYHGRERLLDVSSDACLHWAKYRPFNPYVPDSTGETVADHRTSSAAQMQPAHAENATGNAGGGPGVPLL